MLFVALRPLTNRASLEEKHQFFGLYMSTPNMHIHGNEDRLGLYQKKKNCVMLCRIVKQESNKYYFQIGLFSLTEDEIISSRASLKDNF